MSDEYWLALLYTHTHTHICICICIYIYLYALKERIALNILTELPVYLFHERKSSCMFQRIRTSVLFHKSKNQTRTLLLTCCISCSMNILLPSNTHGQIDTNTYFWKIYLQSIAWFKAKQNGILTWKDKLKKQLNISKGNSMFHYFAGNFCKILRCTFPLTHSWFGWGHQRPLGDIIFLGSIMLQ